MTEKTEYIIRAAIIVAACILLFFLGHAVWELWQQLAG